MSNHGKSPCASRRPPPERLARRIHQQLLQRQAQGSAALYYPLANLCERASQLTSIRHRLDLCREHCFTLARQRVIEELNYLLLQIPAEVIGLQRRMPAPPRVLSPADIAGELEQLDEEFGPWRFEAGDGVLVVTTDSIELEDITLGCFEIRLSLERLGQTDGYAYTIEALEPNCPASNDAVTHPHVRDNQLCEGDASVPIHRALEDGRLCDFFILVNSVLHTYNSGSPHVALDNWYGTPCHECGSSMEEGDSYYCEGCSNDYCSDCASYCHCCDRSLCRGCLDECPACEDPVCGRCLKRCQECDKSCCESCLEEGVCPECVQTKEKAHDDNPALTPVASSDGGQETGQPAQCAPQAGSHGGGQTIAAQPHIPRRTRRRARGRQAA